MRTTPLRLAMMLAACAAAPAQATILGLTVANASSGNYNLTSLSVTRSSAGTFTYTPGQLTGVDLTDVASVQLPLAVQRGASLPASGTRAALLEDNRLDTGVINPFSSANPEADSFEVTFLNPVVNSAGEDIVVLDIGAGDPTRFWVNNNRSANSFDVAAANFSGTLLSGMAFTLYKYAGATDSNVNDLAELESPTGFSFDKDDTQNIVGIGLDLSSFGIPAGAAVTSLRFQSIGTARIDPVLIVGLPPIPLPGDANLDGTVDRDDLALLDRGSARYLSGIIPADRASWSDGDFDRNGMISANDYALLYSAFSTAPSPLATVPEPTSLGIVTLLYPALLRRRRS